MVSRVKWVAVIVLSGAAIAAVPAAPAVAGGGGGGNPKGDSQKNGPNQCRNQKGLQVNVVSCNNINSVDIGIL